MATKKTPYTNEENKMTEKVIKKSNTKAVVNSPTGLNIRNNANFNANVIDILPFGTEVKILEKVDENWTKISANDKEGYVATEFLTI